MPHRARPANTPAARSARKNPLITALFSHIYLGRVVLSQEIEHVSRKSKSWVDCLRRTTACSLGSLSCAFLCNRRHDLSPVLLKHGRVHFNFASGWTCSCIAIAQDVVHVGPPRPLFCWCCRTAEQLFKDYLESIGLSGLVPKLAGFTFDDVQGIKAATLSDLTGIEFVQAYRILKNLPSNGEFHHYFGCRFVSRLDCFFSSSELESLLDLFDPIISVMSS